MAEAAVT